MGGVEHVDLFVEGSEGRQPVEIRRLADGLLEILYSPGLVEGIAAGDAVRVTDPATGAFEVVRRGGNLSVKLLHEEPIQPVLDWLGPCLLALRARLDGQAEHGAVLTIPIANGFPAVDAAMDAVAAAFPGLVWYYGNVYDAAGEPLGWWAMPGR
jgi:hypothetical protein